MTAAPLVTLMFTDVVSSTELAQRLGDDAAEEFRVVHFGLLRAATARHGGREVKNLGDGLMLVFDSALGALGAAVAMQAAVAGHNASGAGPAFAIRIGLHAGEPVQAEGDYFGTTAPDGGRDPHRRHRAPGPAVRGHALALRQHRHLRGLRVGRGGGAAVRRFGAPAPDHRVGASRHGRLAPRRPRPRRGAGLSAVCVQTRHGDAHAALGRYPDLVDHWQRSGAWAQQWLTLRSLVEALARTGHAEGAAVLYGAMGASTNATPLIGADAVRLGAVLAGLRDDLGEPARTDLQARGAGLGDAGAVAYAVGILHEILT